MNNDVRAGQPIRASRRAVMGGTLAVGAGALTNWAGIFPGHEAAAAGGLRNAGFEDVTSGWPAHWESISEVTSERIRPETTAVRTGARAVRLEGADAAEVGLRSTRVPARPEVTHEASSYALVESGEASVTLEYWGSGNTRLATHSKKFAAGDVWRRVDVNGEAPAGATHATMLLQPIADGVAYFDDASLTAIDPFPIQRFGPAAPAAAVRGATLMGDRLFVTARFTVEEMLRIAEVDAQGNLVQYLDMDLGGASGNWLANDGRYVYVGAAGHGNVWRYDPETNQAGPWAQIGGNNIWVYQMLVDGEHLYLGTYPDCTVRRVRLSDATVEEYGRISSSLYATGLAVDDNYVYGGSAAPGGVVRWAKEGGEDPLDLSEHLTNSPVGILDMTHSGEHVYVASGAEVVSFRSDGSDRVVRPIAPEDRFADRLTVAEDGTVYAIVRRTTNLYRVDPDTLTKIGQPYDEVENVLLDMTTDGRFVGVTGVGDIWTLGVDGTGLTVNTLLSTDFVYPDEAQSMVFQEYGQRVFVSGHFTMTVHETNPHSSQSLPARGEAKAMTEGPDGSVYAAMYPSCSIVKYDRDTLETTDFGPIGGNQQRPVTMLTDGVRNQLVVATGPRNSAWNGALTFVDLETETYDMREGILPDQRVTGMAIDGDVLYICGDTYGQSTPGPIRDAAEVAAIDLNTREVLWREVLDPEWDSYERIAIQDGLLYAMGRRPNGEWFSYDLSKRRVVERGNLGGYGDFGQSKGRMLVWVNRVNEIRELPTVTNPEATLIYPEVPVGWYNNAFFSFTSDGTATWGMWANDLALFPLITQRPGKRVPKAGG
ncbi:hypothetical protein LKO27_02985 [Tessaracoccus sp. OS52]|uniref:hypothetical protein n=1 Tax=Tessaracoccus sp. OS52 TaxID=2886691 RepID=UPI001D11ED9B|nr:hypothetical protein [Tessaracoccus sp. OS52]MCC2592390.1 hypothetical protein [Tessaracoccus sp. OS52]